MLSSSSSMSKSPLTIGLIGYQFMGKAHSNAYRQANRFFDLPRQIRMKTICGRTEPAVKKAAEEYGWEEYRTDWRDVVADPEIDIIDVSTPGNSHCEIAVAAAKAGKAVFCEKPIGNSLAEAAQMWNAVQEAGVPNAVFHNYRKCPAIALAKQLIETGRLGELYHIRAVYLQDWIADPNFPLVWRLQKSITGSGALGDIGSHIIDLARYLVGEFESVSGLTKTFVSRRPLVGAIDDRLGASASNETGEVDVDDAALFLAKFRNGVIGTFEATRFAVGRKNHNRLEINGSRGSLVFNLERMNELEFFDGTLSKETQGFTTIQATDGCHPYAGRYWPVGHIIGYEHTFVNLIADAVIALSEGRAISPSLRDGYENQRVLDAVEQSAHKEQWINL